jgi:lysozyme family protein
MRLRTARAIYRSLYWNPLRADALPRGVDLMVFGARLPDSATVEFGVKLTGSASVIIASGTAEANVKVT